MASDTTKIALIRVFVDRINSRQTDALVALADEQIELVGPRGSGYGHQLLRDWMGRANMQLETFGAFARGNEVVLAQHGKWHSPEGELTSEADTFMHIRVNDDSSRVALLARYVTLEEAMAAAGLEIGDAIDW